MSEALETYKRLTKRRFEKQAEVEEIEDEMDTAWQELLPGEELAAGSYSKLLMEKAGKI